MIPSTFVAVWCWLAVTLGHGWLTARWCRRLIAQPDASWDERAFAVMLASIGTLSIVLHTVSILVGLSLLSGLVGLLAWHLALAVIMGGSRATPDREPSKARPLRTRMFEAVAVVCLFAMLLSWVDIASRSLDVTGTDATNYHMPYAVNFSLGASPFVLPPTTHLYPMAGSVVAAWFIVPLHDALLVDLTMSLWFLLLTSSLNYLFRLTTGESGLAWCTWFVFVLFSTPMLRGSSLLSADLVFAAATVALIAQLTAVWTRRRWRGIDCALASLAAGLLCGAKATGPPVAGLIFAIYLVATGLRQVRARTWPRVSATLVLRGLAMSAAALGAGAIWLISLWVLWGSPLGTGVRVFGVQLIPGDAWQPTLELSVLGDMQRSATYSLLDRTTHYAAEWFGGRYLLLLAVGLLVIVDAVVAILTRRSPGLRSNRLFVVAAVIGSGVPLVWMLIGAPWTSLEWTQGLSLRYILPLAVLLPALGFIGLFPVSWRWFTRPVIASLLTCAIALTSLWMFHASQGPRARHFTPVPALTFESLVIAVVILASLWFARRQSRRVRTVAVMAIVLVALSGAASLVAARDAGLRGIAERAEAQELTAYASMPGEIDDPARAIYLAALVSEQRESRTCDRRRFFVVTRFDEPYALQSPALQNQVFYAARDVALAARAGPMGPCDYAITSRPVMATDKGAALVSALSARAPMREIAEARPFVLLHVK